MLRIGTGEVRDRDGTEGTTALAGLLERAADAREPIATRLAAWAELTRRLDAAYRTSRHELSAWRLDRVATARDAVLHEALRPALIAVGVRILEWRSVCRADAAALHAVFEQQIHPVLTPMAVDSARPAPSVPELAPCLAVTVADRAWRAPRIGYVPLPTRLPRVFALGAGGFVTLETVVAAHLTSLFTGTRIVDCTAFRVTRDADGRQVCRIELEQSAGPHVHAALTRDLGCGAEQLHPARSALALGDPLTPAFEMMRSVGWSA